MNIARTMLETGRFSVSDVGFQMGYSSLGHFSAEFKRQFTISPKEVLQSGRSRSIDA
jgi:AraC-like DNA-binding protein